MIRLIKCEYLKTRRRYILLTALVITAAGIMWQLNGKYDAYMIKNGWMTFLYQCPLINSIIMPLLSIIVTSRINDIEHKGNMIKQLATITDKGRIYDANLIYGLAVIILCCTINWAAIVAFGFYKGFTGVFPLRLYLLHLAFTIVPTTAIYIFQHILSLLFKNQAITFFTGIIGCFAGLISMFLPQLPLLRQILLWGAYGSLQFVGLYGWDKVTRYEYAYFATLNVSMVYFLLLSTACIAMYIAGRIIFVRKDV